MDPTLSAIMALLDSVSDPAAAIDAIRGFVAAMPGDAPAADAPAVDPILTDAPKADDKPAFAAAADGAKDEKKEATAIAASATPHVVTIEVDTKAADAVRAHALQSENALRDMILIKDGHRLVPSVRQWASSQSLAVVRGLCAAAPEVVEPPARITATRGSGHGNGPVAKGLVTGHDRELIERAAGTFKASTPQRPHRDERGNFVYPTVAPSEFRRMQAAAAAKDGK